MELIHGLTGFGDLYRSAATWAASTRWPVPGGTHPSAYTKAAIGWLDRGAITAQNGRSARHELLGRPDPAAAVRALGGGGSARVPYLMVEAPASRPVRRRDPERGAIVYRVQTADPLGHAQNGKAPVDLLTTTALAPGACSRATTGSW